MLEDISQHLHGFFFISFTSSPPSLLFFLPFLFLSFSFSFWGLSFQSNCDLLFSFWVMFIFALHFNVFSLIFSSNICLCYAHSYLFVFKFNCLLKLWLGVFYQFWDSYSHFLFYIAFAPFSLFSPFGSSVTDVRSFHHFLCILYAFSLFLSFF